MECTNKGRNEGIKRTKRINGYKRRNVCQYKGRKIEEGRKERIKDVRKEEYE